ncbi:hypothetical protein QE363_000912 [Sphingomonas sp. SORGH_AS870]|uniref:hypothetical protein n=1 Tax=Sphingomonas sp. SORGH_AS_0870 TaxID=3041801 RepID=UPI0028608FD8|nr:hypothetical protein [Sphingomonas sp. SORGH_AS_0870]MDR6145119.1 hypothetical protein [Sphingomonas sp. SORGH_AS_0870]
MFLELGDHLDRLLSLAKGAGAGVRDIIVQAADAPGVEDQDDQRRHHRAENRGQRHPPGQRRDHRHEGETEGIADHRPAHRMQHRGGRPHRADQRQRRRPGSGGMLRPDDQRQQCASRQRHEETQSDQILLEPVEGPLARLAAGEHDAEDQRAADQHAARNLLLDLHPGRVVAQAEAEDERDRDQILQDRQRPGPAQCLQPLEMHLDQQLVIILDEPQQGQKR